MLKWNVEKGEYEILNGIENHFQKEVEKDHRNQVLRLTGYLLGQDVRLRSWARKKRRTMDDRNHQTFMTCQMPGPRSLIHLSKSNG
jgi:hypothetical protein